MINKSIYWSYGKQSPNYFFEIQIFIFHFQVDLEFKDLLEFYAL